MESGLNSNLRISEAVAESISGVITLLIVLPTR